MERHHMQQISWLLAFAGLLCPSIPAFPQSAGMNYVRTRTMRSADGTIYMDDIQYYDGLGRPVQLVRKGFTPQGNDLASQTDYDDAGRVWREWLPAPFPSGGGYKEGFAANATTEHGDGCPYAETAYEQSPLDRAVKRTGPGAHWHTSDTGISTRYTTNLPSGNYAVKWYSAARPILDRGTYPTGQLLCAETTDENGNITYSFTDKAGRTVLVRRMNGAEAHDTYYVYDTAGRLRLVLPPMVDGDVSLDNLNRYAYRYEYDDRGNCTFKKLPGRDAVYHVYDRSNRLILEQDGNQRSRGVWKTFKYDRLGRLLYTAEIEGETRGRDALIAEFATYSFIEDFSTGELPYPMGDTGYSRNLYAFNPFKLLEVYYYDSYDFIALTGKEEALSYQPMSGFSEPCSRVKGLLTGKRTYILGTDEYLATAYYYDERGNLVGESRTNHLEGSDHYCHKYTFTRQLAGTTHRHSVPGKKDMQEATGREYDHAGRALEYMSRVSIGKITMADYEYDEWGRLSKKTLSSGVPSMPVVAAEMEYFYDIRDRLIGIASPLFNESISYDDHGNVRSIDIRDSYNRGMAINNPSFIPQTSWVGTFSYDGLHRLAKGSYVYGTSQIAQTGAILSQARDLMEEEVEAYDKNGNILSMKRKGKAGFSIFPAVQAVYDDLSFSYDGNQLVAVSDVSEEEPVNKTGMQFADGADEEEEYEYDANGNMVSDKNKGIGKIVYNTLNLPETVAFSDNDDIFNYQFWLSPIAHINTVNFTYAADGTKLKSGYVTFKEVSAVQPARTNAFLPDSLRFGGGLLDSTRVIGPGTGRTFWLREVNTVTYAGNYQYENDTLSKKFFPDGYIDCSGDEPVACFYLKDHLGNVRMVVDEEGNIVQVNDYYPFGALYGSGTGDAAQRYKYNGKELERMHGLDWYDYGARWMDPVLCRFTTMDPLCEKYYDTSPYAYCANNPMKYIDPDGRLISPIYDPNGNLLGTDDQGLQGDAMVLKKEDFKQGMNHDDASKLNLGLHSLDENVREKVMASVKNLESRPDYDGFVTIDEGVKWAKNHPYALANPTPDNTLYINAALLDFGDLSVKQIGIDNLGKPYPVNMFTSHNTVESIHNERLRATVYALGRVNVILQDAKLRTISIVNDEAAYYDWNKGGSFARKIAIGGERIRTGLNDSHGFRVYYYGYGILRK